MITGRFHDRLLSRDGRLLADLGERHNHVLPEAWALVGGLLAETPGLAGLRFLALGVSYSEAAFTERHRVPISPKAWVFLDEAGEVSKAPTPRLRLEVELDWGERAATKTNAFSLVGGEATSEPGTGTRFNHATHDIIRLTPGLRLSRRILLDLSPDAERLPRVEPPSDAQRGTPHPLLRVAPGELAGVGRSTERGLIERGLEDIEALTKLSAGKTSDALLRTRARWIQQTLGALTALDHLRDHSVEQLCTTPAAQLAEHADVEVREVERLQDHLSLLKLLHQGVSWDTTLGELTEPG